jgi:hypothetical protein
MRSLAAALIASVVSVAASPSYERSVTLPVEALSAVRERGVRGRLTARCAGTGTVLAFELSGLVPDGTYSIWMFVFADPRDGATAADVEGAGAAGAGARAHEFRADAGGRASLTLRQPAGPLSAFGRVRGCLLDAPQWRVIGAYHPRRVTAGTRRPPGGDAVEQFGVRSNGNQRLTIDE